MVFGGSGNSRRRQRPTTEEPIEPTDPNGPAPPLSSPQPSDLSTVVSTGEAPLPARPLPPQPQDSERTVLAGAPAGAALSSSGVDDKAHGGVASEEVVEVDRGGSHGSSSGKGQGQEQQKGLKVKGGEGKVEEAPAPGLEAQRKARSLPTVLRSSYRGDWRLLLRRLQHRRGGPAHAADGVGGGFDSDDDEGADDDGGVPKGPPSMISSLQSGVYSVRTFVAGIEDRFHRMPKWKYRVLVGSLIFLLFALGLLVTVTVVYGFGMSYPHISLVKLELALPFPHLDRDGSIPVLATVEFNNPNAFRVRTEPATVKIYTMQQRTPDTLLGQTAVPAMELKAHGEGYQTPADFAIRNVGRVKGGQAVVDAVLQGTHSFLYTETEMDIVVKSLGFMPIARRFQANCKILKVWGGAQSDVLLSDCYGQFGRQKKNPQSGGSGGMDTHKHRRLLRGAGGGGGR